MVAPSRRGRGYSQKVITPYMHCQTFRVPVMMQKHGSLRHFSGQGIEKVSNDLPRYFHRKINRWDAATNLLLVEKRQEVLKERERAKCPLYKEKALLLDGGWQKGIASKKYGEFHNLLHRYTLNLHNCLLSQHNSLLNMQIYPMNLLTKNWYMKAHWRRKKLQNLLHSFKVKLDTLSKKKKSSQTRHN